VRHDGGGGGGGARRAVVRPLGIYGAVRLCKRVVFYRNVDVKPWRRPRVVVHMGRSRQSGVYTITTVVPKMERKTGLLQGSNLALAPCCHCSNFRGTGFILISSVF